MLWRLFVKRAVSMMQIREKIHCFKYSIQHKSFVDRDLQFWSNSSLFQPTVISVSCRTINLLFLYHIEQLFMLFMYHIEQLVPSNLLLIYHFEQLIAINLLFLYHIVSYLNAHQRNVYFFDVLTTLATNSSIFNYKMIISCFY